MSTETGEEKRRLSKRTSETDEGATELTTNENVKESEKCDTSKNLDGQRNREKTIPDVKDQNKDGRTSLGTRNEESTTETRTNIKNIVIPGDGSRQIIAVSANKNPTAFFQLARKFLMTNEMCDLSALEGAIVSAVDAAHLLERSKLASIVRIHTSYVNVEPKRRRQVSQQKGAVTSEVTSPSSTTNDGLTSSKAESSQSTSSVTGTTNFEEPSQTVSSGSISDSKIGSKVGGVQQGAAQSTTMPTARNSASSLSGSGSRELRRARILVTVKRTENYKRWLEENPTQRQAIIAGTATMTAEDIVEGVSSSKNNDSSDMSTSKEQTSTSSSSKN